MSAHLLLLDGPPEPRHLCRDVLERAGYRVRHAADARDAIAQVRDDPPLAILLIAEETELFHRLVRALRLHPATSSLPILVISPSSASEVRGMLEAARPIGWIEAPFTPRRLLDEVHYVTRPGRAKAVGGRHAGGTGAAAGGLGPFEEWRDERMRRTWGGLQRTSASMGGAEGVPGDRWLAHPAMHLGGGDTPGAGGADGPLARMP